MKVVTKYPNGVFSWVDLATTDPTAAKVFYKGLFGWEYADVDTGDSGSYSMCQIDGKNVAGMGGLSPDMIAQGMPPIWSSYVNHDDVDAIAEKITANGGSLMVPPMDVMDAGRMALGTDPTGAAFGVWQPANHIGAQLVNMPNTLVWNELQTRDREAAKAFFMAVFGWEYDSDPNDYGMFKADGRIHAGMIQMDDTWDENIPNNWTIYFMVEDVEASAAKAKELGGNLLVPPTQAGEMGKFAAVQDPQGGAFTIMEFSGPVDPPPGH